MSFDLNRILSFDFVRYVSDHPRLSAFVVLICVLAAVGTWYVVRHHLRLILVTLLCAGGLVAGTLVIYRGWSDTVLIGAGIYLLAVFPMIWLRAVQSLAPPKVRPAAPLPTAAFDLEIKPKAPKDTKAAH